MTKRFHGLLGSVAVLVLSGALAGCGRTPAGAEAYDLPMAPLHQMPDYAQSAPGAVQQAYQFAVANPEILSEIPCYCGCTAMGHTSNYDCYVAGVDAAGVVTFDQHALWCGVCVSIAQDTMRLMGEGKDVAEIRAYVDQTYARYAPVTTP